MCVRSLGEVVGSDRDGTRKVGGSGYFVVVGIFSSWGGLWELGCVGEFGGVRWLVGEYLECVRYVYMYIGGGGRWGSRACGWLCAWGRYVGLG